MLVGSLLPPALIGWELNINAIWSHTRQARGLGWVLRDYLGRVRIAGLKFILKCCSMKFLEAMAILDELMVFCL